MYQLISKYRGQIMGAASVMIVLLHFVVELYPDLHISGISAILGRGNIGVDMFLLVSGMGLWFSMSKDSDAISFWKKRIHRVLIPALVLTFPYWLWYDLYLQKEGIVRFCLDWTGLSFWTHGVAKVWYVSLILVCYLLYPLVFQIQKKNRNLLIGTIAILIAVFSSLAAMLPDIYERYEIALTRIPVFLIGSYLGEYIQNKQAAPKSSKVVLNSYTLLSIMAFAASVVVNSRNHMLSVMLYRYGSAGIGILICFAVCLLFEKIPLKLLSGFLKYLGAVSLELYLIHVMIRNVVAESPIRDVTALGMRIAVIGCFILVSLAVTWLVCTVKSRLEKTRNPQ